MAFLQIGYPAIARQTHTGTFIESHDIYAREMRWKLERQTLFKRSFPVVLEEIRCRSFSKDVIQILSHVHIQSLSAICFIEVHYELYSVALSEFISTICAQSDHVHVRTERFISLNAAAAGAAFAVKFFDLAPDMQSF